MNLYTHKKRWKWLLFFSACIAFIVIIYYSNLLLKEIAHEERKKVNLWADAITHKAQLVNYTTHFFESIKNEEGKRASLLAKTLQKVYDAPMDEDVTFYLEIIQNNTTIPTILTQEDGTIDNSINVTEEVSRMKNISELGTQLKEYDNIKLEYDKGQYVYVYFKLSQIYADLRSFLENLQQSFFEEVVINTASIPVIITDSTERNVILAGNIDSSGFQSPRALANTIAKMKSENNPIRIDLPERGTCYVFYEESSVLTRLRYFPYIQFSIILVFAITAYLLFSFARRSEQNRVWVGMSKETAHQLGTPISSLMAWNELLKETDVDPAILGEMDKDVKRLETIAQRFSKIGSVPELHNEEIVPIIENFVSYLQTRISTQTKICFNSQVNHDLQIPINRYLFEWVIENLCKNSVDAMEGAGSITLVLSEDEKHLYLDITDTGKGISPKKQKTIFKPGYTSKNRGWGLGLTLAQRIIKDYHKGKLFVKNSVLGKGTTMRIVLSK